ncbi:MAG: DsbA family oxidoreductase [Candidatus Dormibacteria bacterium]
MNVEVWSDIVCPWCYIGKRNLESALARFEHRAEVEVEFRSFELDPAAPSSDGRDLAERLAAKYGVPRAEAEAMNARVTEVASKAGLDYHLDVARPGNTFEAHQLIHCAREEGRGADMKERLMAAYFIEGRPIGEREELVRLGQEVGLGAGVVQDAFESRRFAEAVRAEEREAAELGISGVPYFVIDRRFGVSGAQPPDLLLSGLQHAWSAGTSALDAAPGLGFGAPALGHRIP